MEILSKEQWRVERIKKVIKIVCAILAMDDAQLGVLVKSIDDHHGRLQVFWHHPMTDAQIKAFGTAWSLCGESEISMSHNVFW